MSAYITHSDESIFRNPFEFLPERWIDKNGQKSTDLEPYQLSFSKDSRQCTGMQWVIIYLYVFLEYKLPIFFTQ